MFCLSCKYFKINKWVSCTYDPYAFLYGIFVLVSGFIKSVHEPFKIGLFFSYSSIVFLDIFPFGFQNQVFWWFIFPVQDLRVGGPDVELRFLTLQGKVL